MQKKIGKDDIALNANWDVFEFYGEADIAIFYSNLRHWIKKNETNQEMIDEDGRTWTYHSVRAFGDLFHFWSPMKIRIMLEKLEGDGFIFSGEFRDGRYTSKKYRLTDSKDKKNRG